MKNNNKIIIVCICALCLFSICLISYWIMNKPLDVYYESDKFGNFDVRTERPNNHTVNLVFESTYIPESWRIKCLYEARYILSKDMIQAKLILEDHVIPLETSIAEHKHIKLTLTATSDNINIFEYQKLKNVYRKMLKFYNLELCFVFLNENHEKFEQVFNLCKPVM